LHRVAALFLRRRLLLLVEAQNARSLRALGELGLKKIIGYKIDEAFFEEFRSKD
jgi:hypothetical protein